MSIPELKLEIIKKVISISDGLILDEIIRLIKQESALANSYQLIDEEQAALKEGLQDVEDRNLYSSESAEKMLEEWLKK